MVAREAPLDQFLPGGRLVVENLEGAADARLGQVDGGLGVQEGQQLLHQVWGPPEHELCPAGGHLLQHFVLPEHF